jgi:hypothetical protein
LVGQAVASRKKKRQAALLARQRRCTRVPAQKIKIDGKGAPLPRMASLTSFLRQTMPEQSSKRGTLCNRYGENRQRRRGIFGSKHQSTHKKTRVPTERENSLGCQRKRGIVGENSPCSDVLARIVECAGSLVQPLLAVNHAKLRSLHHLLPQQIFSLIHPPGPGRGQE